MAKYEGFDVPYPTASKCDKNEAYKPKLNQNQLYRTLNATMRSQQIIPDVYLNRI